MKAFKVTISGSYRNSKKEIVDYGPITGIIPAVDPDIADMHVRGRYARVWIKNAKNPDGSPMYPERIEDTREIFIDDKEEVDFDFSFAGKDIKAMSYEELQDLATFKDLRNIPLPKEVSGVSLREMRTVAYAAYSDTFFKTNLMKEKDQAGFNFAELPEMIVSGGVRRDPTVKISNDEVLKQEEAAKALGTTPKENLTIDDLKKTASEKKITYPANITFDDLYAKLYGGAQ